MGFIPVISLNVFLGDGHPLVTGCGSHPTLGADHVSTSQCPGEADFITPRFYDFNFQIKIYFFIKLIYLNVICGFILVIKYF